MKKILFLFIICFIFIKCNSKLGVNQTISSEVAQKEKKDTPNDWLCINKERVGPITATTTEADLKQLFGAKNVVRDSLRTGNTFIKATKVLPDTPNELRIAWKEGQPFEAIQRIIIAQPNTDWHTPEGITIGVSLQKIEELNEAGFNLFGFNSVYAGSVSSWEGGKLDENPLGLRFYYQKELNDLVAEVAAIKEVMVDDEIHSSYPILKQMQVEVTKLFIFFD